MIGLYSLEENKEMAAFADGLKVANFSYKYRNHNHFTPDQVEGFDAVVVTGLRCKGMDIRNAYASLGVPVIVIDYGYMKRVKGIANFDTGHWQVGLNRLGWVPAYQCSDDRFKALGIEIQNCHKRGSTVLVCGQHAGDPSHGLDEGGIANWAKREINNIRAAYKNGSVLWRPHPDSAHIEVEGHDGIHSGPVDWSSIHAVVAINSNIGHEALLAGVPVFCRDDAPYAHLANLNFRDMGSPFVATIERRKEYFSRLAYAQWTLAEMRNGLAADFIINTKRKTK